MKLFITVLIAFLSFSDGKAVPLDPTVVKDPGPHATNVSVNVAWAFNSGINITVVEMSVNNLKSLQYAALGLGQHQAMGEAHVFMCKRYADDKIAIERYVNPMNHSHPVPAGSEDGGIFTPLPSTFKDGVVTCQFALSNFDTKTVKHLNELRPLSQSERYHPLFAVGVVNATTGFAQYHDGREPQPGLVRLDENQNLMYQQKNTTLFN